MSIYHSFHRLYAWFSGFQPFNRKSSIISLAVTDMLRNCSDDVLAAQALWNPLTPLSGAREWDTEEVQAFAKKWGGRPAYVEEIAGVVAIICNPESAWMTGSVVSANGGLCFST